MLLGLKVQGFRILQLTHILRKKNYFKLFQQIKYNYRYKWNITVSCEILGWMKHKHQDCWEKYQ